MRGSSFDGLPYAPGEPDQLQSLGSTTERLMNLERIVASLKVGDLPVTDLENTLEKEWTPDASALFPSGTISYESLPFRLTYGQVVGATGAVSLAGTGDWTSVRNAAGDYTITFPAYRAVPIAFALPANTAVAGLYDAAATLTTAQFKMATDNDINFLVVGR